MGLKYTKAVILRLTDAEKVIDVFCDGNAFDPYYKAMFYGEDIRTQLRNYYSGDIRFALQFPYSYAVLNSKNKIMAQLLAINVDTYLSEFPGKMEHLMKASTTRIQEWNNYVVDFLKSKEHPNIFCFDFEVVPTAKQDEAKLLKSCVSSLISTYGKTYSIASDHSIERSKMWESLGFETYAWGETAMCIRSAGGN